MGIGNGVVTTGAGVTHTSGQGYGGIGNGLVTAGAGATSTSGKGYGVIGVESPQQWTTVMEWLQLTCQLLWKLS